jgi:hypothetical protein
MPRVMSSFNRHILSGEIDSRRCLGLSQLTDAQVSPNSIILPRPRALIVISGLLTLQSVRTVNTFTRLLK